VTSDVAQTDQSRERVGIRDKPFAIVSLTLACTVQAGRLQTKNKVLWWKRTQIAPLRPDAGYCEKEENVSQLTQLSEEVTRKATSPSGSSCRIDSADFATIGCLDLGEQDAHRGDDASHDQRERDVRVRRLHEIPLTPALRRSLQCFARLTVLVNGERFGR
jgi:hypothetical protein